MSALVSRVLADAEGDVRRRFSRTSETVSSAPSAPLSLLSPEDWTAVLRPLAPDTPCDPDAGLEELVRYVQLRCAEVPMRLQMEALQTRRYEHLLRQHTRELVTLSEYVTLVARAPPTFAAAPRGGGGTTADASSSLADSAALPSDLRVLLDPEEVQHRLERAAERISKLEMMLRHDAAAKVQCCQRMVLLSEYMRALLRRVRREVGEGVVVGSKRARSEEGKS
ncbi:hypothetical protein ABB37_07719 [Leptomonas pyrrhocoris]|uniref:Uncharacterized protein n=1 Tax=Leptomonas pyrrhocoris TaxID=157538 RepID=A0A0M9FUS3_LEPPY|nr:hypothetical protein ABB37_07719 [Leptomonas pyrrhocoris]KPA76377.1 hypothetical protein ABB37_07719 [Leptomonas pyrrhocoris]|eukprot:XP_015654816.1 hypothetical protein ABB37_07719 [Leptomonas pyrrhocoris]